MRHRLHPTTPSAPASGRRARPDALRPTCVDRNWSDLFLFRNREKPCLFRSAFNLITVSRFVWVLRYNELL